ncbi:tetratricopeptide repeat protein [Clostridium beijerinckii]|uniref:tetratricopeptide repeat protein n=1 Tax=Clostridium beijerinckii TaxID=1520 RepID=UPI00047CA6BB|nr:hypothetical protein [Clostridium beijerinckii]
MKKSVIEYISDFKKSKYFTYISDLKKSKYFKYISDLKKDRYFTPPVIIVICLSAVMITNVISKSRLETSKDKLTIAANSAEENFYNDKYDAAIEEYNKYQEKDEWPIWNLKIAEIYSVKGNFADSNELLTKVYLARNKVIDSKKQKNIDNFEAKDRELTNYIVFTSFMNGDYDKALQYGELFLMDYPTDKNLLKTMFTIYMANDKKDKMKEIVDNYPKDDESASDLADLARMNMMMNNLDQGLSLLKDAWHKDKNEVKVFDVITQIAEYNKNDILNKISAIEKKDSSELAYKMWQAEIYSKDKDSAKKANDLISELEDKDVGSINLALIKSNTYQNLGESEKARDVLNEMIKNDQNSFIGYHAMALEDYSDENYDDALKNCEKSISLNKDYADNYGFLMPEIMEKQDKSENAEPYFRTALYKEPFNYNILIKLAEYYGNTVKDSSRALYYYTLASKMNTNDAEVYYNMALIKVANQRQDEAIDLLKKSIAINGKEIKYHRALGTVYLNKEKGEDALKEIKSAYAIDKNDILTLNNAGCYYVAIEGDLSRGLVNFKAAYDGMNDKTSEEDRDIITENYNRVKNLSDAYNKRNGATLKIPDLKLFY